jgi:hypothetical protein
LVKTSAQLDALTGHELPQLQTTESGVMVAHHFGRILSLLRHL